METISISFASKNEPSKRLYDAANRADIAVEGIKDAISSLQSVAGSHIKVKIDYEKLKEGILSDFNGKGEGILDVNLSGKKLQLDASPINIADFNRIVHEIATKNGQELESLAIKNPKARDAGIAHTMVSEIYQTIEDEASPNTTLVKVKGPVNTKSHGR